jgi:hypothetical protein
MIRGAGRINAVAVAQRGANRALALPTLAAHPPLRAAGYASASGAHLRVGAARTIHASRLSCLAAGYASASAAHLINWAARPVHAGFARGTTGCATHVGIGTTTALHAGLTRGTATGRAADLIIDTTTAVHAGLTRGTTHTGASAGVACEASAAITRATRATVAGTVVAAISRTTHRRGESCRATRRGRAQALAMGSITGTSSCCRRIGTKDGCAPLGTGLILRRGGADAAQTEDAAKRSSGDEFDGLTA